MHILFLHTNFPAQFGQIAVRFAEQYHYRCTFASEKAVSSASQIAQVQFIPKSGATEANHYASRSFENVVWRSYAAYEALKARTDIKPDIIVGHSGFASTMPLRELYPSTPQVNYFEFFYHTRDSDMDFRNDLPMPSEEDLLRARWKNAALLLDLQNCDAGYAPTDYQRSQLPVEYQSKIETIFDGIDTDFWKRQSNVDRTVNGVRIPEDHQIVTYVSRGFEAMRGFDMFLQVADQLCRRNPKLSIIVAGEDRIAYGGDARYTDGKSFKEWAIDRHKPDLSNIHFVGRVKPSELVRLFSISDVHLYWTAPFVLSWSLMNALSCECRIVASDTAPVREMIRPGINGLLCDFFNVDQWIDSVEAILKSPLNFDAMAKAGRRMIEDHYSIDDAVQKINRLILRCLSCKNVF